MANRTAKQLIDNKLNEASGLKVRATVTVEFEEASSGVDARIIKEATIDFLSETLRHMDTVYVGRSGEMAVAKVSVR